MIYLTNHAETEFRNWLAQGLPHLDLDGKQLVRDRLGVQPTLLQLLSLPGGGTKLQSTPLDCWTPVLRRPLQTGKLESQTQPVKPVDDGDWIDWPEVHLLPLPRGFKHCDQPLQGRVSRHF